jgi:cardiolipin synthase
MSWWAIYEIAGWLVRLVMVVVIVRRHIMPVLGLAWLVLILAEPFIGVVLYLLLGTRQLGGRRARIHQQIVGEARTEPRMADMRAHMTRPVIEPEQRNMIVQAERISGNPIVAGNDFELIAEADDKVAQLVADIDAAQHHVHILYYIFRADAIGNQVIAALKRAARRGVTCRVLLDAAGSRSMFKRKGPAHALRQAGVEVVAALPVRLLRRKLARIDLRNHRKIVVVDGRVGYTGSHNIVVEDYGHKWAGKWVDLSTRFTGPIVAQMQMVFIEDWYFETDKHLSSEDLFPGLQPTGEIAAQAVPTGPSHEAETFRRVVIAALNSAQHQILMTTPYLVPDEPTILALAMAADRGAEVTIVLPARSDHPLVAAAGRSYYELLLDAGVSLYRYRSGMLHAKTITVDHAFALLGSANLDIRSFYLNFEINLLLYGPQITNYLRFAQHRYLAESDPIVLEEWRKRPATKQCIDNAAALLSPLL